MAFFPRSFYHPVATPSFTPLIRFLDDADSYSRQWGPVANTQCRSRRVSQNAFQPKFDVREVGDAYELHGELPGVDKENVQIEFTDPQVMVIRGKVERTYTTSNTTPHDEVSSSSSAQDEDTAMSTTTTDTENDDLQRKGSHQATVEDEAEGDENESSFEKIENPEKQVEKVTEKAIKQQSLQDKQPVDQSKYWMTERSIGQFSRSFKFPGRVDQDTVSASFHNGILTVTVPKAKKHESRRIVVN